MKRPALSFVIPVRNDAVRLGQCLESIQQADHAGPIQVIVADNGSTDESMQVATAHGALALSLPGRRVSEVRNEAVRYATADLIGFVDADHTIGPVWIGTAIAVLAESGVCAAGADYHAPPDGTWVQQMYDLLRRRSPEPRPVDWLGSGNLVVRRSAFEQVGGFDTSLESCEDVDLCRKLRSTGGRIVATDAMYSVHHGDPRSLTALFAAELWRGRDNLRVSLRERLTPGSAIGLAMTLVQLASIVIFVVGLATSPLTGWGVAVGALLVFVLLACARTAVMIRRAERIGWRLLTRAFAVALVYDAARALALIVRAGHDVRRRFER